jgi:hypothetical protein
MKWICYTYTCSVYNCPCVCLSMYPSKSSYFIQQTTNNFHMAKTCWYNLISRFVGVFLVTLLVGTLLSSATIIPLVIDDQNMSFELADTACMASPWLYSLGFVLTFAALFAKTYRISRIFNNKKVRILGTKFCTYTQHVVLF